MDDLISRQAAIDAIPQRIKGLGGESWMMTYRRNGYNDCVDACLDAIRNLPSTQLTLYGYKIEHLAYIARVMEKEGVTADYVVRTFDDMSRAIKMIIDEMQQKVEEALNG